MLKKIAKKIFPGVSWKNPIVNFVFKLIDPIDYIARSARGLSYLPPYSIRVRSTGVSKECLAMNFYKDGVKFSNLLKDHASLNSESKVLEIGCGCGRTAFALSSILDDGNYYGVDIEKISLDSCKKRPIFLKKNFHFEHLDIQNDEYNPDGKSRADTYKFLYDSNSFNIVFMISVFTHMLTDDVKNYIAEISRILKPEGYCMFSTFLMDHGRNSNTNDLSFPYNESCHYFHNQSMPEIAVGYDLDFYVSEFASVGMTLAGDPLWGSWRKNPDITTTTGFGPDEFGQDILFFKKENEKEK